MTCRDNFYNKFYGTEWLASDIFRGRTRSNALVLVAVGSTNATRAVYDRVDIHDSAVWPTTGARREGIGISVGGGLRRWHCATRYIRVNNARSPPIASGYVQSAERAYTRVSLEIITSCTPSILRVTAESPVFCRISPMAVRNDRGENPRGR